MTGAAVYHGGDLAAAEARFGRPADGWVDLSTGINPWPYPHKGAGSDEIWTRLPDGGAFARLTDAACGAYGAPDSACVVAAPGTQALIQWLPRLRACGTAAILSPTYAEHAESWSQAGHAVSQVADFTEADVIVLTRPNNPDGRIVDDETVLRWADRQAARGGWLVIDEAFVDPTPEIGFAPLCDRPGLIVLRSFGKFYGLAGVRLGFALAEPKTAHILREALGPWCVSGPAIDIGTAALNDSRWAAEARARIASAAADLDSILTGAGLTLLGGTRLFRLAEHLDAQGMFQRLAEAGILVRPFPDHPTWLRFGLPGDATALERLRAALA